MEKKFKLGVIGAGFMANAILGGAISSGVIVKDQIVVFDINENSRSKMSEKGFTVADNNEYIFTNSDFILFAIKPQNFIDVANSVSNIKSLKIISIMAGVKKEKIGKFFLNSKIARCMPNTPCSIKKGAIGLDVSDFNDYSDKKFIIDLFGSIAEVVELDESKLNAVTAISGSSPAYFYLFAKALIDAGCSLGLNKDEAQKLVVNTMIGSGEMILANPDKSIEELIASVCSKGGTTIEAVKSFDNSNLDNTVLKATVACFNRSVELENS